MTWNQEELLGIHAHPPREATLLPSGQGVGLLSRRSPVQFPEALVHQAGVGGTKNLVTLLDLCVSSLRRGHANLLCIVPILSDDLRRESVRIFGTHIHGQFCVLKSRS